MSAPATPSAVGGGTRPEIQALRAIAVTGVVLFHVRPELVPGGFVGVDVFFVISGFLITGHLLREIAASGRIQLPRFWARRARRLLPAALVVLLFSAVLTFLVLPVAQWANGFREIIASALYVENWTLAANSVDYLAADNAATMAQHYWSLSVEEQFYLVWPLLLLLVAWLTRRRARRIAFPLAIGAVVVASLVYSIVLTTIDPAIAYFVTPTRMWELGAGGLLALLPAASTQARPRVRAVISWVGLAVVAAAYLLIDRDTPFPGWAALLPVVGALLVIGAGSPTPRWAPSAAFRLRPVQVTGDLSYSLYLWHWPVVIAAAQVFGTDRRWQLDLGIVIAVIVLSALSKRFVEDPLRDPSSLSKRKARWTFAFTAGGIALVSVVAAAGIGVIQARSASAEQAITEAEATPTICLGAAIVDPGRTAPCDNAGLGDRIVPDVGLLGADTDGGFDCAGDRGVPINKFCHFGPEGGTPVALVGDSHAVMMLPALKPQLERLGWRLDTYIGFGCAWGNWGDEPICDARRPLQHLLESGRYAIVIEVVTSQADEDRYAKFLADEPDPRVAEFEQAWAPVVDAGTRVIVIKDNPAFPQSAIDCLTSSTSTTDAEDCAVSVGKGWKLSDAAARAAAEAPGVALVDLGALYCDETRCPLVEGNVAMYYDRTHMTATFSRSLSPALGRMLDRLLADPKLELAAVAATRR
jgi:peptidoglycan/LPS O-acetylase OafA/YrhL